MFTAISSFSSLNDAKRLQQKILSLSLEVITGRLID
jgi:hypothetical protein